VHETEVLKREFESFKRIGSLSVNWFVVTQKCHQKKHQSEFILLRFISVVKPLFICMLSLLGYEDSFLNYLKKN